MCCVQELPKIPDILQVLSQPEAQHAVRTAVDFIRSMSSTDYPCAIGFYCKSGTHRSVGCAAEVERQFHSKAVVQHLCQFAWPITDPNVHPQILSSDAPL